MIGNSDDETNFPHKLLLTDRQVARLPKAFVNNSHASAKLSKTHISNIIQFGGFFRRILEPLKARLPLMKNIIKPLTKSVDTFGINSSSVSNRFAYFKENSRFPNNSIDHFK